MLYKYSPTCTVDQHLLLKLKNVKTSRRTNDVSRHNTWMNEHPTASRANGLLERFQKGTTVLGLFLAKEVMMGLEGLNTSLQGRGKTVGGMLSAVDCVKKTRSEPTNRRSIRHSLHQCRGGKSTKIFYSSKSTITLLKFYLSTSKSTSLKIYSSKSKK